MLPSVSSLKALRAFARNDHATKPMTGFGDPYSPDAGYWRRRSRRRRDQIGFPGAGDLGLYRLLAGRRVDRARLGAALPQLPDTADELKALRGSRVAASDIHLGADASETTVKRARLSDYGIVYFATHGLVAGDVKGLAEPSLALTFRSSRPNSTTAAHLERSRAAQTQCRLGGAVRLQYHCRRPAGGEALSGLARSFFYAGARALLVSHWAVDSEAATRLAIATFDRIKAEPKIGRAEALRQAMLAYLNDASSPRNAYPAFWGPFALIGEGAAR